MSKQTEALKLALETLENAQANVGNWWPDEITAIREALAEQPAQQEPVAWKDRTYGNLHHQDFGNSIPLYTSPPNVPTARASKPLTDEEIKRMAAPLFMSHYWNLCNEFARAIEAAHGIKENT